MTSLRRLDELKADAGYYRDRRDRYQAKMYGPRPASLAHLKELERVCALSESGLRGQSKSFRRRRHGYRRRPSDDDRDGAALHGKAAVSGVRYWAGDGGGSRSFHPPALH